MLGRILRQSGGISACRLIERRSLHVSRQLLAATSPRIVPISPSFFTKDPVGYDFSSYVESVLAAHENAVKKDTGAAFEPVSFEEYKNISGASTLKSYRRLVAALEQLAQYKPEYLSADAQELLTKFAKVQEGRVSNRKIRQLDEFGRAYGAGFRKEASAQVYVVKGTGQVLVNGKHLDVYFPRASDRARVVYPLEVVSGELQYNAFLVAKGGGTTGQADACALAIARALVVQNPGFKDILEESKCLFRDPRTVERKKPGRLKARKRPTWVKR
ncbi:hypothetical protein CANCADRAFT_4244 [Tortispora caseinolytica NRRL Y-17796]|uniref:Small ribosomal subunit protein uS9m n=1 Tax=Tortispora caseinolytica NRRL Y-17796 TaxID=767744 RepID=A0A1E4TCZ3_9ASCO|nr:hypothetical protein CANCADRAFT_4244 [Tortispora caseinolytica NRRL Y-17796]